MTRTGFANGLLVTSRYDAGGRLLERGDATGTTTYVYDRLNRLVEERLPAGGGQRLRLLSLILRPKMTQGARSRQVDQSLPRGLLLLQQRAEYARERWQKHEYLASSGSCGKQQGCLLPSLAHGSSSPFA